MIAPAAETSTALAGPQSSPKRVALAVTGTNINSVSALARVLLTLAGLSLALRRKA
ncbi:hypothetical protein [Corynebacterium striatum]|uniref:hypothetical protein n=1 Tax=Corynebacterium striatum TaxID=43770 RepID=UPI001A1C7387|nr:hypothetical protein [Corynebacterium striatum]HAT1473446.1 hypothetical protein [Corynebacterium striatum]HAT6550722.1 hypothetical protein [Corynebacterium striatum]HAT6624235.1 hypothetical protein [Corynebacterium striatum]HAT6629881.1 hypothetical protein [Corynebacterium striatum]